MPATFERTLTTLSQDETGVTSFRADFVVTELEPCPQQTQPLRETDTVTFTLAG